MQPVLLSQLASILGIKISEDALVKGFCIDSRNLNPGELFFALPGNKVDGHSFIPEVVAKGASAVIAHDSFCSLKQSIPIIGVPDVLLALRNLAQKIVAQRRAKVIGITGTLGKTTAKEFLKQLLSCCYKVFASPASYNSQITLPLSVLFAEGDEDFLILEMGMTHPGNIAHLTDIVAPDIAVITTIGIQHACNFPDGIEGIGKEKASIFLKSKTEIGFLSQDMPYFEQAKACGSSQKWTFSLAEQKCGFFWRSSKRRECAFMPPMKSRISLLYCLSKLFITIF